MAMNKGLKATLIILGVGVTGFGAYLLYKKFIKPKMDAKKDEKEAEEKLKTKDSLLRKMFKIYPGM